MKKILSAVLAGAMLVSTASTAFAANAKTQEVNNLPGSIGVTTTSNALPYFDSNGIRYVVDLSNAPVFSDASDSAGTVIYPDSEIRYKLHIFNQLDATRADLNGVVSSGTPANPAAIASLTAAQAALTNYINLINQLATAGNNLVVPVTTVDLSTNATLQNLYIQINALAGTSGALQGYSTHNTGTAGASLNAALVAASTGAASSDHFTYTSGHSVAWNDTYVTNVSDVDAALASILAAPSAVLPATIASLKAEIASATNAVLTNTTASAGTLGLNALNAQVRTALSLEQANVTGGTVAGLSNLTNIPLSVNLKFAKGQQHFKKGEIKKVGGTWYAVVKGIDPFISIDEIDIDFEVYLAQNGTSNVSDSWQYVGKYANRETTISYTSTNNTQYSNVNTAKVWKGQIDAGNGVFDFGDNVFADFYVTSEKKYYLNMNRKENEEIIKAYPDAALTFFDFMGNYDTFSRIGKVYIPQDLIIKGSSGTNQFQSNDPYIYELIGDELVPIDYKKASIPNRDVASYMFETKSLGYYVISDIDLSDEDIDEDFDVDYDEETPEDTTTGTGTKNPSTGSNDFVNIAVVAAVVSLAAAGAVAFKKASK